MSLILASLRRRGVRLGLLIVCGWVVSLGASFLGGVFVYRHRDQIRTFLREGVRPAGVIQANLYNIAVQMLPIRGEGRDGGIEALEDGLLLANRLGRTWFVTSDRKLQSLELRIPINFEEFANDPYNVDTNRRDQFAVKDIFIQDLEDGVRLTSSYNYWYADEDCYTLRVAALEATTEELRAGSDELNDRWMPLFETFPCASLTENPDGVHRNPTLGAGGRLAALPTGELLLSVGGFGPETIASGSIVSQTFDNTYGKTILIDPDSGDSRIYTLGHRNPQGLAVAPDGVVWLTEHAARGGDELNRIVDGRNYGFPLVSYGTEYESLTWGTDPRQGHHDGFEKPVYAWVPSIGVSQLVVLGGAAFKHWAGDLLVGGMATRTLYRVHLEGGHAVVVEPIPIGHRSRDLAEMTDGTIVVKSDADFLLFLRPVDETNLADLEPEERGAVIASACAGCHSFSDRGVDGLGPSLFGVMGRRVASRPGFAYSPALLSLGGQWTEDRLRAYIHDPQATAPGTNMALTADYDPEVLDDLIAFLKTLR